MRPNVLILEAQAKASLPIIESCARHGLRVIAAAAKRRCMGFYSRACRERLVYPPAGSQPEACIEFLLDFLSRRRVQALFPVGDVMTDLVARHQDRIRRHTALAICPYETFVRGRSKIGTLRAAAAAGVPIPASWYPDSRPLEEIAREADYPALIKPAISAGARGITRVDSAAELLERWPAVAAEYGEAFVQDFVPQHGMQYKADLIVGRDQRLIAGVAYEKLRYYPPNGGSSVLNRTVDRPDIVEAALRVLRELGWFGFCDFDFIEDPRDGVVKLMEINPRYPESFRATVAAGLDMAHMMYRLATEGDCPADRTLVTGRCVRFLLGDVLWFLTSPDRWRSRPSFFAFLRRDTSYQVASLRDPGPLIGYLLDSATVMLDARQRASRLRLTQARAGSPAAEPERRR